MCGLRTVWLHLIFVFVCLVVESRWTEQDEARRIEQLMEAERKEFMLEQSVQAMIDEPLSLKDDSSMGTVFSSSSIDSQLKHSPHSQLSLSQQDGWVVNERDRERIKGNWCFYCASPPTTIKAGMRKAIEELLRIRRTSYPFDAVNPQCSRPSNISELQTEHCQHQYCQTLIITDHDTGSAITLRGCAEKFGAINEEILRRRGDNVCLRLHDQLDIQECICKHRKYCYGGAERSDLLSAATINAHPANTYIPMFFISLSVFLSQT
ncbi:hypothetical protein AB6A40_001719 [Gnathostoma spinigerum]|uniref:Uncharacterized protein n=1 Tax=Gnathostoma spinigerum TaxID=75299 RepID=A0ABD6E5U4_9BILA